MNPKPGKKACPNRISLSVILILCLTCIIASADAAPGRGTTPPTTAPIPAPRVAEITTATTPSPVTCQAPCSCMDRAVAIAAWGADGFSQCAELPCEYGHSVTGAPVEKYCFRQKLAANTAVVANVPPVTTTPAYLQVVTIPVITQTTAEPKHLVTLNYSLISDDTDQDSIPNDKDNCPAVFNPGQDDADRIFIGCPPGAFAKMPDAGALALCAELTLEAVRKKCEEAAWKKANPGFTGAGCNYKSDGKGDVCDNCRAVQNTGQADADGDCASFKKDPAFWDGTKWLKDPLCGDACDRCPGQDDHIDSDKDGVPDGCDKCQGSDDAKDADNDGIADGCDTCWYDKNPGQADSDGDCAIIRQNSTFWDGSKWLQDPQCGNSCDNCPQDANPEQLDSNNDGTGDACSCTWCTNAKVRPVYIRGPTKNKIDIVFIPSSTAWDMEHSLIVPRDDYNKTESVFRAVVFDNIQNGFFKIDSYSTSPVPADFKDRFNFYYYWDPSSFADAHTPCGGTLPDGFATSVPFRDAAIILYPKIVTSGGGFPIGGCSAGFGTPAQISAPGFWPPTLLHESGHGVFGLVDTYCSRPGIDTSYWQSDPYSNVWTSESNCKQAPTSQYGTLNPANCRRIEADDPATPKNPDCSIDFWRSDPDPDDMRDCDFSSRFGTASVRRIDYVFDSFTNL